MVSKASAGRPRFGFTAYEQLQDCRNRRRSNEGKENGIPSEDDVGVLPFSLCSGTTQEFSPFAGRHQPTVWIGTAIDATGLAVRQCRRELGEDIRFTHANYKDVF